VPDAARARVQAEAVKGKLPMVFEEKRLLEQLGNE
jgi:hypothetical protein